MGSNHVTVTDVYNQRIDKDQAVIHFSVNEQRYTMIVNLDEDSGVFLPDRVFHRTDRYCSFCDESEGTYFNCEWFFDHLDEWFHRLIEYPRIRLEWLYLPIA